MYVAFDQLAPHARVWIYQASRALTSEEVISSLPALAQFADAWTSHGQALLASAEFLHQQFLIIGLDEGVAGASGCSIDASVRFVREMEQRLGLDLLDKSQLAFLLEGKVWLVPHRDLKAAVAEGTVQATTFYFDNTLTTKKQLDEKWPTPAAQTWLSRYFVLHEKTSLLG